jgi:1-deoxy-D-xylulose-5-phosphate synthase
MCRDHCGHAGPTGLTLFAQAYPTGFDVGIAEQHAAASAAGMSYGGLHPVVALYATFLNRAFDQVLMDCALHRAGVTFVLDRAGVTGDDGASHNGVWDISMLSFIPGVRVAAPRDGQTLRTQLDQAVEVADGPTVVRYPKGALPADIAAVDSHGGMDVLARLGLPQVLLVSVGAMANRCLAAADLLAATGTGVTVIDPGWILPVPSTLPSIAAEYDVVITVEDGSRVACVTAAALGRRCSPTATVVGYDQRFLAQGRRADSTTLGFGRESLRPVAPCLPRCGEQNCPPSPGRLPQYRRLLDSYHRRTGSDSASADCDVLVGGPGVVSSRPIFVQRIQRGNAP